MRRDHELPETMSWHDSDGDTNEAETQRVAISLPPTPEREVLIKVPIHLNVRESMQEASMRFQLPVDQCIVQRVVPTLVYLYPGRSVRIPHDSASAMRKLITAWRTHPEGRSVSYYPHVLTVGQLVAQLQFLHGDRQIHILDGHAVLPHHTILGDLPTDFFFSGARVMWGL